MPQPLMNLQANFAASNVDTAPSWSAIRTGGNYGWEIVWCGDGGYTTMTFDTIPNKQRPVDGGSVLIDIVNEMWVGAEGMSTANPYGPPDGSGTVNFSQVVAYTDATAFGSVITGTNANMLAAVWDTDSGSFSGSAWTVGGGSGDGGHHTFTIIGTQPSTSAPCAGAIRVTCYDAASRGSPTSPILTGHTAVPGSGGSGSSGTAKSWIKACFTAEPICTSGSPSIQDSSVTSSARWCEADTGSLGAVSWGALGGTGGSYGTPVGNGTVSPQDLKGDEDYLEIDTNSSTDDDTAHNYDEDGYMPMAIIVWTGSQLAPGTYQDRLSIRYTWT